MSSNHLPEKLSDLEIEETKDGSPTLFIPSLDERYHSTYGARTESEYIFIKEGLREWQSENDGPGTVLEVGFGTGLNALLTILESQKSGRQVLYHAFEINPLPSDIIKDMWQNVLPEKEWEMMELLHEAAWDIPVKLTESFTLHKRKADLIQTPLPDADILYMDAFAPEKTPELWSEEFLRKLYDAANNGGRFSTYCAKGIIRRRLQEIGFSVYRTPGPPGGKREILTAKKD